MPYPRPVDLPAVGDGQWAVAGDRLGSGQWGDLEVGVNATNRATDHLAANRGSR